jgi:hypothetical protein
MAGSIVEARILAPLPKLISWISMSITSRGMCKAKRSAKLPFDVPNEGTWVPSGTSIYEEVREIHLVDDALVLWSLPDV